MRFYEHSSEPLESYQTGFQDQWSSCKPCNTLSHITNLYDEMWSKGAMTGLPIE
jgi:hypothetical protein